MKTYSIQQTHLAILAIILLVAVFVRVSDGGATTHFRYDQATLSQLALEMANGESLPLTGIESSAGVPNSPITVYFLAIPYFFTSNPLFVTLYVALWNVVGVALVWLIGHRYFEPRVGIIAGFAYAVSPFAITYSRSIWAQDYHTPFILAAIFLSMYGFLEGKRWAQVLALPILLIGVQIHFAAYTLVPIWLWIVFQGRRNIHWLSLGVTILLGILTFVPFALGVAQQPDGTSERVSLITDILRYGVLIRWYPLEQIYTLMAGISPQWLADAEGATLLKYLLWQLMGLASVAGFILVLRRKWLFMALTMWVWALITVVAFIPSWTGSGVYLHYFIPSIPAFSLLAALSFVSILDVVPEQRQAVARYAIGILLAVIFGTQIYDGVVIQPQLANDYTVRENGQTTTPMHILLDVREQLQQYDDIILIGANPHESNTYIWQPMLYDTVECVRDLLISDGWVDILPAGSYAAVVAPLSPINENYAVPERYITDNPITIPLREGEDPYIIYEFDSAPEWTETEMTMVDVPVFENGVHMLGYYLQPDAMQIMWSLPDEKSEFVTYFGHFLNAEGERIGQRDLPFYTPEHWCEGDTIVTSSLINLPEDTATLRIGMYMRRADGGTNDLQVLDDAGNTIGQWIDIALDS